MSITHYATDPRPAWTGPCRCRECVDLRRVSPGLAAAHRWPARHTEAATELVEAWRDVQRRRTKEAPADYYQDEPEPLSPLLAFDLNES